VRTFSATFSDADHAESLNEHWTAKALTIVDRVMAWRDTHGDGRFVDVAYADLVDDPLATVRSIYAHFGEELSSAAEAAMAHYVDEHPRGEHGSHRYAVEALGLDPAGLAEQFAPYAERFAIQPEGVRS
jgi:LPS sulfotransferase NodH